MTYFLFCPFNEENAGKCCRVFFAQNHCVKGEKEISPGFLIQGKPLITRSPPILPSISIACESFCCCGKFISVICEKNCENSGI